MDMPMDMPMNMLIETSTESLTLSVDQQQQHKCLSFREHALARPEAYVGSLEPSTFSTYLVKSTENIDAPQFVWEELTLTKALFTVVNEIIANAVDHHKNGAKQIHIEYDVVYGDITIKDDGGGIPVDRWDVSNGKIILEDHLRGVPLEEMPWIPTVLFSQDKSGSKFNDQEERTGVTGRFGYGAKASNVYCKRFQVETVDPMVQRKFVQTWYDNLGRTDEPRITKSKLKRGYTEIRFLPDYERFFGSPGLTPVLSNVIERWLLTRAFDVTACTSKTLAVYWNGKRLQAKNFKEFVGALVGSDRTVAYDEVINEKTGSSIALAVIINEPDEEGTVINNLLLSNLGIVNGLPCSDGTLMNYLTQNISQILKIASKQQDIKVKPSFVKKMYTIVMVATLVNPTYTNVIKDRLTLPPSKFGVEWNPSPVFSKKVASPLIVAALLNELKVKDTKALLSLNTAKKNRNGSVVVPKYEGANNAGRKGARCVLILTEGDSAKTLAVAGLSVVGRDNYGVFPLRGKLKNVRGMNPKALSENEEISALMKILGLRYGDVSQKVSDLRYQDLVVFADQDYDGAHIFSLVYNWIHYHYKHLLQQMPNFVKRFVSPIMKIWPKGDTKETHARYFFSLPDVEVWQQTDPVKNNIQEHNVRYYKGLGTSTTSEAKYYFSNIHEQVIDICYTGPSTDEKIELLFGKRAEDRKNWLISTYDAKSALDYTQPQLDFDNFADKEYTHFCMASNVRTIPSVIDGLKPGQRKVMHVFLQNSKLRKDIKVSEVAGIVSTEAKYHHGSVSLENTIIGMAQNYIGSNNINYLIPQGQYGSRLTSDGHASARYLFTRLNPITRLLFRKEDDAVLKYETDEGCVLEPEHFVPVIPILLVNGANGIGVGWSCEHPSGNPIALIDALSSWLKKVETSQSRVSSDDHSDDRSDDHSDDPLENSNVITEAFLSRAEFNATMIPYYEGFEGTVLMDPNGDAAYVRGSWDTNNNEDINEVNLHITELPPQRWLNPYIQKWQQQAADSQSPLVTGFSSLSSESKVDINIKLDMTRFTTTVDNVEKYFKLSEKISLNNKNAFNQSKKLVKYETPHDVLMEYIPIRIAMYRARKEDMLKKISQDSIKLRNKCRFVTEVVQEVIIPSKCPKIGLVSLLSKRGYDQLCADGSVNNSLPNYDYLLNMKIVSFTLDLVNKLQAKYQDRLNEIEVFSKKSLVILWLEDLKELREATIQLYEERQEQRNEHLKLKVQNETTKVSTAKGKKRDKPNGIISTGAGTKLKKARVK